MAQQMIEPSAGTEPHDPAFERVLVGVDGSEAADDAVRRATRVATLTDADLEVVHARQHRPRAEVLAVEASLQAEETLRDARLVAEETGAHRVTARLLVGNPVRAILAEARERWADLVCVGHHPASRPYLASVTGQLVRRASCSVLAVRRDGVSAFPGAIMVGVDGSAGALEATRQAAALASRAAAPLLLLHVLHGSGTIEDGERALAAATGVAARWKVIPIAEMTVGEPADAILHLASASGAGLVVVGAPGHRRLGRPFVGSIGDRIARHADRTVLVARARPA